VATFVRTQSIAHRIGERGGFTLTITAGEGRLKGVPGDEASVRATFEIRAGSDEEADRIFEAIQLRVETADGHLLVEERDGGSSLGAAISQLFKGRGNWSLSVEAEVPRLAEVRLEGVSADIQADALRGEQRYASISGDLYLTELGGSIRVNTVSGDVTIRAAEPLDVRVDAVSGDVSVVTPRLDGLHANSVSGDLEIEGQLGSGEFGVETVSGDLTVGLLGDATFEVRGLATDIRSDLDHRIEGRHDRRRVIVGGGGPEFSFSSMSGDLHVRRPRRIDAAAVSRVSTPSAEEQLAVLRALEAGEIDVEEATRRLAGGTDA
jgi:putative adhesin